ncbi:MAG: YwmB family TATA-box binding protein [Lachnospiraceae bacterium]|nr:YwmB family TATA-box binding protein [Lachnospiraceae bacterium]
MKRYQTCFLIILWAMVFIQAIINITAKNDYKLVEAFKASNSIPIEGKVIVSGSLGDKELDDETKENILKDLANQARLANDYQIRTITEDEVETIILKKEGEDGSVWFRISSVENVNYLTTEVAIEDVEEIFGMKEQLESIMEEHGIDTESSLYVHGSFERILNRKEKNQVEKKLLSILEANVVLEYKDEYQDTIYCYSPLLSTYYERDGKKMNIQMILTYDESNEQTQLYLAVPFYNEGY